MNRILTLSLSVSIALVISGCGKNDNGYFNYYSGDKCEFKLPTSKYSFGYFYSEYEKNYIYKMKSEDEEDRFNSDNLVY